MRKVPQVFLQLPLFCFLYPALGVIVKAGLWFWCEHCITKIDFFMKREMTMLYILSPWSHCWLGNMFKTPDTCGRQTLTQFCECILALVIYAPKGAEPQHISIILSISKKAERRMRIMCHKNSVVRTLPICFYFPPKKASKTMTHSWDIHAVLPPYFCALKLKLSAFLLFGCMCCIVISTKKRV